MRKSISFINLLLVLLFCWLYAASAHAAEDEFERHYQRAVSLYQKKDYEPAAREFVAAYQIRQLPRLLINIGQAYRKQGKAREALSFYYRFLEVEPDAPAKLRLDVEGFIEQAKALLEPTEVVEVQRTEEQRRPPAPDEEPAPTGWNKATGQMEPWWAEMVAIKERNKPLYKRPWFWGIIIGSAVVVGVTIGVAVGVTQRQVPGGLEVIPY